MSSSSSSSTYYNQPPPPSQPLPSCVICTNTITTTDATFPPPCNHNCDSNVCLLCLTHLSSTTSVPSCPNCGSNMCIGDVNDTILLRRHQLVTLNENLPDSELNAKELRERMAFGKDGELEKQVQIVLERCSGVTTTKTTTTTSLFNEEDTTASTTKIIEDPIDESLFEDRIDYSTMTIDEKRYVTKLMTSGDYNQLAQAAQILMGISDFYASNAAAASSPPTSTRGGGGGTGTGVSSEREAMVIRALAMADLNNNNNNTYPPTSNTTTTSKQKRQAQKKYEALKLKHPLPTKMPKCITLQTLEFNDPFSKRAALIKFEDEEWDGSVSDAFSWVYSNRMSSSSSGDYNNDRDDNDDDDHIGGGLERRNKRKKKKKVLVKSIKGKASSRLNIEKGDVVTHVNGEVFEGNANDLRGWIKRIQNGSGNGAALESGGGEEGEAVNDGEFTMVFNADEATAVALRERAVCLMEGRR